jgi:hypothetical protein
MYVNWCFCCDPMTLFLSQLFFIFDQIHTKHPVMPRLCAQVFTEALHTLVLQGVHRSHGRHYPHLQQATLPPTYRSGGPQAKVASSVDNSTRDNSTGDNSAAATKRSLPPDNTKWKERGKGRRYGRLAKESLLRQVCRQNCKSSKVSWNR